MTGRRASEPPKLPKLPPAALRRPSKRESSSLLMREDSEEYLATPNSARFTRVVVINSETQTDWDWADGEQTRLTLEHKTTMEDKVKKRLELEPHPVVEADDLEDTPEPYLQLDAGSRMESTMSIRSPSKGISRSTTRTGKSIAAPLTPWPPRQPEYGVPIEQPDSDEEDADLPLLEDDDTLGDTGAPSRPDSKLLPSLGPPKILELNRESEKAVGLTKSLSEYTQEMLEPITSETSEGFLTCEFCDESLREFPTLAQQQAEDPETLYCCDMYRQFVEYVLEHEDTFEKELATQIAARNSLADNIDGDRASTVSSQKNRVQKKEKESDRKQEMAIKRQQQMLEKAKKMREQVSKDSKQMKTINFQLSNLDCYKQGLIVVPPQSLLRDFERAQLMEPNKESDKRKPTAAQLNAIREEDAERLSQPLLSSTVPVTRYFENGGLFLNLFADGSATVLYPSGNLAISITSHGSKRIYTAYDDSPRGQMLAHFWSLGYGAAYFKEGGAVRLSLTPYGGLQLGEDGSKKRKWAWLSTDGEHSHAPPFQPVMMHLNQYLSIRLGDRHHWLLTFFFKQDQCKFNLLPQPQPGAVASAQSAAARHSSASLELDRAMTIAASQLKITRIKLRKLCQEFNVKLDDSRYKLDRGEELQPVVIVS